jgi:hypothetical protein
VARVRTLLPVAVSRSRTAPSSPVEATRRPSGSRFAVELTARADGLGEQAQHVLVRGPDAGAHDELLLPETAPVADDEVVERGPVGSPGAGADLGTRRRAVLADAQAAHLVHPAEEIAAPIGLATVIGRAHGGRS